MWVHPKLLKCVAFLGYWPAGETQPRARGTAFFVQVVDDDQSSGVYLVTAEHNVRKIRDRSKDGNLWVRVNTRDGRSVWVDTPIEDWKSHPSDSSVDAAAIPWKLHRPEMDYMSISANSELATSEAMDVKAWGLGDEVIMIGLFNKHPGIARNLPVVRTGTLAAKSEERIWTNDTYGDMYAHLVEIRSIGGLSGSPVWLNPYGARTKGAIESGVSSWMEAWTEIGGHANWLGLVHGHFHAKDSIADVDDDAESGGEDKERIHTGLAIVVPIERIIEVLNRKDFKRERQERAKREC